MADNVTSFALELVEGGWWAKEVQPDGWFDRDLLDTPSGGADATATGATLTKTYSLTAGAASGQQNRTASGATLTEALSLTAGAATGQQSRTASGTTLPKTYSVISGAASGQQNRTASGTTFAKVFSLIAGTASGQTNATASGVTLTETLSLTAGTATGQANRTASGVAFTAVSFTLLSGSAQGQANASAGGATLLQTTQFAGGAASATANPTALGFTGNVTYLFTSGTASGSAAAPVRRGDDAGARERFWRAQAEEWLEERLDAIKRAARGPQRARKRLAARIVSDVPSFVSEIPEFAPRIDALARLGERLQEPTVDYTAMAQAVAAQLALIEAWNTRQRRRRDMEALLILAA